MEVTQDMYLLAKHALKDIDRQQAGMNRVLATCMMGSRIEWAAIVTLFEDAARDLECHVGAIQYVTIYDDDSATASIMVPDDPGIIH